MVQNPVWLHNYDGLAKFWRIFGDDLGAGQILALKLRHQMGEDLTHFISKGAPIIGICNGFQVLIKLGLLPDTTKKPSIAFGPQSSWRICRSLGGFGMSR